MRARATCDDRLLTSSFFVLSSQSYPGGSDGKGFDLSLDVCMRISFFLKGVKARRESTHLGLAHPRLRPLVTFLSGAFMPPRVVTCEQHRNRLFRQHLKGHSPLPKTGSKESARPVLGHRTITHPPTSLLLRLDHDPSDLNILPLPTYRASPRYSRARRDRTGPQRR